MSVPAMAAWTDWEDYSTATFEPHYWYKQPQKNLQVERREDTANPARVQFKIKGMFGEVEGCPPVDLIINANFDVHAPTANDVAIWIDDTYVESFTLSDGPKAVYLCDAQTYYETFFPNNPEYSMQYESASYFRQETGTFHIYSYYHYSDGTVPYLDAFFKDQAQGPETIKLHSPEFKDYTPEFGSSSFSIADGQAFYNLPVDLKDLSKMRLTVREGAVSNVRDICDAMNHDEIDNVCITENGTAALPFAGTKGSYTVVYLTYKADGTPYQMGTQTFDYDPDWKDLGTAEFTDAFIAKFLEGDLTQNLGITLSDDDLTYPVEVQESISEPGIYRLINPYGSTSPYWNINFTNVSINKTATHYMIINATDPERVFIPESCGGFYYGSYPLMQYSEAYDYLNDGFAADDVPAHLWGKMKNGVITFGEGQEGDALLGVKILESPAEIYGRSLVVKLPGSSAVTEVETEHAEREYYTLQGIKVSAPVKGEVTIVREGSKVRKIFVK